MFLNGNESMGFVETASLVAAIEASDAMLKAANVCLEAAHKSGGGRVCVFVHGDLASCQAAVAAGRAAAERCGAFLHSHVLARPDTHSEALWAEHIPAMRDRKRQRSEQQHKATPAVSQKQEGTVKAPAAPKRRRTKKNGKAE